MRLLACGVWLALAAPGAALAAGNVTTTQTADTITIRGDSAANEYDVKHGTDDQGNDILIIEGKNGTTINGTPTFEIRLNAGRNKFDDVIIFSGGGADVVNVDLANVPADKRLDELHVDAAIDGTTTIKNVQTEPGGKIAVSPGGTVSVESCDSTGLEVTGLGGGTVTIKDCNVEKKLTVDTPDGDTEVTVQDSSFGDARIKGGSKVNVVNRIRGRILRSTGKKVSFEGGAADDEISFEDSSAEQASIKLGGGDDLISFAGSELGKTSVDGGAGDEDCLDDAGTSTFASFKEKGFEAAGCLGLELDFLPPGSDPFAEPPEGAVAWLVSDGSHEDGPFALPGAENPFGLPVLDPAMLPPPAHWGQGPECVDGATQLHHVHDAFDGHDDPNDAGCGHGMLSWGFLVPI